MNTLNILKYVCVYLNKDNEYDLLSGQNAQNIAQNKTCKLLLFCLNYVLKRIATEFSYCKAVEQITFENNEFNISSLQHNLFAVISLKDANNNSISFNEYCDKLEAVSGTYCLTYAYLPGDYDFLDDITCFSSCISEDIVALGVLAHYFLLTGFYSEHNIYEQKFIDRINLLTIKKSEKVVKGKVWQ